MKRRQFLTLAGGGVILAAGAGASAFALTREPARALEPWQHAGSLYSEPRQKALSYAILAPNPHNRQPWLVDLSQPNKVVLTVDLDRLLPHTDPFNRQITIGLGCFLELMRMAAAQDGYRVDLDLFPAGADPQKLTSAPVAIATFTADPAVTPDPLFGHVMERRSTKEPFDTTRPVSTDTLEALSAAAGNGTRIGVTNDATEVQALRELTTTAMNIEIDTPLTYKESVDLFRIGKAEVNANPDGIDFSGAMFDTMAMLGLFTRDSALDTSSTAFQQGRAVVLATTETAMAHIWMVTDGNSRADQIRAGADWLRINLAAAALGVDFHPLSQALQEYPEMKDIYTEIHRKLAPGGSTIQMLSRLGYGPDVPVSPRWPLDAKIIGA